MHEEFFSTLLAILELIDNGCVVGNRIAFSDELRDAFHCYFNGVRRLDDKPTIENPFHYLQSDGFWMVETSDGPLRSPLGVSRLEELRAAGSLDSNLWLLLQSPLHREQLREAIICRFFSAQRDALRLLIRQRTRATRHDAVVVAEPVTGFNPVRTAAFRKVVVEVYDFQCAACGLRIKLPPEPVTFVDAAHLIPFAESHNDHPSNGIALCKNHHWAMDKALIAPGSDLTWHVTPGLLPHRSTGEAALVELAGRPVLPPHDRKFRPSAEALRWRETRLGA